MQGAIQVLGSFFYLYDYSTQWHDLGMFKYICTWNFDEIFQSLTLKGVLTSNVHCIGDSWPSYYLQLALTFCCILLTFILTGLHNLI